MRIRVISLLLLLGSVGSAFAGIPVHSNEQTCPMGMMRGMDCCERALSKNNTPQVAKARLCCALNCSEEGTTPTTGEQVQPKTQPLVLRHVSAAEVVLPVEPMLRFSAYSHGPPGELNPAYIRHLALLI
jgi:hypothetical protein